VNLDREWLQRREARLDREEAVLACNVKVEMPGPPNDVKATTMAQVFRKKFLSKDCRGEKEEVVKAKLQEAMKEQHQEFCFNSHRVEITGKTYYEFADRCRGAWLKREKEDDAKLVGLHTKAQAGDRKAGDEVTKLMLEPRNLFICLDSQEKIRSNLLGEFRRALERREFTRLCLKSLEDVRQEFQPQLYIAALPYSTQQLHPLKEAVHSPMEEVD
jgi:hypothetical protein